jgi:DNA repair exonuclease SbcCD nuclease subunit
VKFLLLGDLHLSDKPPSGCTESYTDDLFALLAEAATFAVHCEAVIIAGDCFHLKSPIRTSHSLVLRTIEAFRAFGVPVYVVPGNHDIQFDKMDTLFAQQPLGVVIESGAARLLDGWGALDERNFFPVYGLPWLQHWTDEAVTAALAPYREECSHFSLLVAHAPLYPEGQELKWEHYSASDFAEAMGGAGSVFYGHVHEPHGVWTAGGVNPVTFCNNGALSRGSLHEYNKERQVGITIWDSETAEFEFVPLHARPASEVLRFEQHAERKQDARSLDEFLAGVAGAQLAAVSAESVLEHLKAQPGWTAAEQVLAEELLAEAAHG